MASRFRPREAEARGSKPTRVGLDGPRKGRVSRPCGLQGPPAAWQSQFRGARLDRPGSCVEGAAVAPWKTEMAMDIRMLPGPAQRVLAQIDAAGNLNQLVLAAGEIRRMARAELGRGIAVAATTRVISQLNDRVTDRVVTRLAAELGLDLARACWLEFGSQGRLEQTLVTDQDNGLVFAPSGDAAGDLDPQRARWLELGRRANLELDACGYTLCRGGVMAGNPPCCKTVAEWCARFDHWMEHGAPQDLLGASIYFDLRALTGRQALVAEMKRHILARAQSLPRFLKQMADNALQNAAALGWFGAIHSTTIDGRECFDLKLHGTMVFVDAARLYALAYGVAETGTAERLAALAPLMHVPEFEAQEWLHGFDVLQGLRMKAQIRHDARRGGNPNVIALDDLSEHEHEALHQALRAAQLLQQRIGLDYQR